MELHEVEVLIDKNGEVVLRVRGVKGKECLDLTGPLEQLLGGDIKEREMTYEALEEDTGVMKQTKQQIQEG